MRKRIILLVLVLVFALLSTTFAAIIVDNRTGAIKIFMPDGKQIVVQKDDPMPVIPDGAIITILAGSATVGTTGDSIVSVSVGTYTIQLKENSKVDLTLNPDGTMTSTIILGEALVTRKVEAFQTYRGPAGPEVELNENPEDVSPSK